jgi:TRAP-type C4-dicarboxylate transport system substrate-binding protein
MRILAMPGVRHALVVVTLSIAAGGCAAGGNDSTSRAEIHHLRYATSYSPNHPFSRADHTWLEHVRSASGGRLAVEPYWAGSLLSADHGLVEIRHGVSDMGLITPIYSRGGTHALRAQSGFYSGVKSIADQVAVYKCLAREFPVFDEELGGLHVLAVQGGSLPSVVTRNRPVQRLSDFRGLRLRAPVELMVVLRRLGADPVNMPMADVYSALSKGVIDGVVAPGDTLRSLHFAEVARYYNQIAISRGAYPARAISEKAWRALPPDLQHVLSESQEVWERALNDEVSRGLEAGERHGREMGVTFVPFDPEDQQRFDAIYVEAALANAEGLARFGIDGRALFQRAQQLIGRINGGERIDCAPEHQPRGSLQSEMTGLTVIRMSAGRQNLTRMPDDH